MAWVSAPCAAGVLAVPPAPGEASPGGRGGVAASPLLSVPTLLAAFRDVRKTHPSAGLVIVGAGEDEGKLRELVRLWNLGDSILLAGWVPYDECLAILGEADVFARTTLYDGDASSVREALALGVPVVASRTDFRPDGVVVFPPGDAEALRVALVETLAAEKQPPAARAPLSPASDEALVGLYRRVAADGAEAV